MQRILQCAAVATVYFMVLCFPYGFSSAQSAQRSGHNITSLPSCFGIIATNYDWGKKRIASRRNTQEPYSAKIALGNYGSVPVTVLRIITSPNGIFNFNAADFSNLVLNPDDEKMGTVTFNPISLEAYQITLQFEVRDYVGIDTVESVLTGIGSAPMISAKNVDFGVTHVQTGLPNIQQVEIKCEEEQWDPVTITDLISTIQGNIGESMAGAYGTAGFRYDKQSIFKNEKIILQPGESLVFPVEFLAQYPGLATAGLTTVSDAEAEVTVTLSSKGVPLSTDESDTSEFSIRLQESSPDAAVITLQLPSPERVRLMLYDAVGRAVYSSDGTYEAGKTTVRFITAGLPTGIYRILAATPQQIVSLPVAIVR